MIRVCPREMGHGLKLPFQFEGLIFTGWFNLTSIQFGLFWYGIE